MYILSIGSAIVEALRSLMLSICEIVYKLIVFFFDIFMMLGSASILTDETILEFYERVGFLIGLFMTFKVVFSLIQYVINPDMMIDKSKGLFNIVKRIIIVIVLLGSTPSIFKFAFKAQNLIIDSNIIPKIITGQNIDTTNAGSDLAWYAFSSFYTFDEETIRLVDNEISVKGQCPYLNNGSIKDDFIQKKSLRYAYNCVNSTVRYIDDNGNENFPFVINFDGHGLVALIVGLVILWMILMYVIQVGIRTVQLAYLQLIAPVPIIMYLTPKGDDTLNKWFKQCITTYIDFFIRIAILYFVIFIIDLIISNDYNVFMNSIGNVSGWSITFINIIIIIALLLFAQKVPKLLKEVFPISANAASFDFGLNPKKTLNNTWAAGLIGGAVGAVGAGVSNAVHGYMNMSKAFKNNGGLKSGKAWGAAIGAGLKGTASVAGGILGGAKAGLKTKDISKSGEAIKTANKNRTDRELRTEAGYHWYNPLPAMGDKILEFAGEPGATDNIKNRQQAIRDEKKRQSDLERGKKLYDTYSKIKPDGSRSLDPSKAFSNDKYRESYEALGKAKGDAKKADLALSDAQAELNAARISNDDARISRAKENYDIAYGNSKAMQGKVELAKAKHDSNKKIYADDAEVENLYKYYSDTHAEAKPLNNVTSDDSYGDSSDIDNSSVDSSVFDAAQADYREKDDQVSVTDTEVANAIAKEPFSDNVKSSREKFVNADQARDDAAEIMKEVTPSNAMNNGVGDGSSTINIKVDNASKPQLMIMKKQLENRKRALEQQYFTLEKNQQFNDGKIDTAQFSKLKTDIYNLDKEIQRIDSMLNNL